MYERDIKRAKEGFPNYGKSLFCAHRKKPPMTEKEKTPTATQKPDGIITIKSSGQTVVAKLFFNPNGKETFRDRLLKVIVKAQFVNAGICANICVHDKKDGNPHAHFMLTMRHFDEGGKWAAKQKKEYVLDRDVNKIYDRKNRPIVGAVSTFVSTADVKALRLRFTVSCLHSEVFRLNQRPQSDSYTL